MPLERRSSRFGQTDVKNKPLPLIAHSPNQFPTYLRRDTYIDWVEVRHRNIGPRGDDYLKVNSDFSFIGQQYTGLILWAILGSNQRPLATSVKMSVKLGGRPDTT